MEKSREENCRKQRRKEWGGGERRVTALNLTLTCQPFKLKHQRGLYCNNISINAQGEKRGEKGKTYKIDNRDSEKEVTSGNK